MELEVFSDPVWGLGGRGGITTAEASDATRYDETIVKPALLIADRVVLRSWRMDIRNLAKVHATGLHFPVPLIASIRGIVERRSPAELEYLGIDDALYNDLKSTLRAHGNGLGQAVFDTSLLESEAISEYVKRRMSLHRREFDALSSPALDKLVKSGSLEVGPWDDRQHDSWLAAEAEHESSSFDHGWTRMEASLASGDGTLLIDDGIGQRFAETDRPSDYPSTNTLSNALTLLGMLDGLAAASLDEVADIREDVSPYIAPFRSFLLAHAAGMDVDQDAPIGERRRQAAILWESSVAPAVRELEYQVRSSRFLAGLVKTSTTGPEAAIGIGLGLATSLASGAIGFTALSGLAVAALPTMVKATAKTLELRGDARRNSAYLVYAVQRRLRTR